MANDYHLGCTAVYDGTTLNLTVWVEKQGQLVAPTTLKNARLLDASGVAIAGATWADQSKLAASVYTYTVMVAINSSARVIFDCVVTVDGVDVPLRCGMARP